MLYILNGGYMVYVDLLIIQDLIYNYVILLGTSILLTRITNIRKIFLSSVIGTIPLIFLFINISNSLNFFISFLFSIIMSIITFSYKDLIYMLKNIFYMYSVSIFLAGGINLININLFPLVDNSILNIIILIMIAPLITYIYIKGINNFKDSYSNYYRVDIYLRDSRKITMTAFLDTGNKLMDPYKHRPIIIINKSLIDISNEKILLVPYNTVNTNDLLKCIVPDKIFIENVGYKTNFLIGLMDDINIDGVDCILNSKLLERI